MYTAIVVASVCGFQSLMETICGSVMVQRDRVRMYMAILTVMHRIPGRQGIMYQKTDQNSDSEQN